MAQHPQHRELPLSSPEPHQFLFTKHGSNTLARVSFTYSNEKTQIRSAFPNLITPFQSGSKTNFKTPNRAGDPASPQSLYFPEPLQGSLQCQATHCCLEAPWAAALELHSGPLHSTPACTKAKETTFLSLAYKKL